MSTSLIYQIFVFDNVYVLIKLILEELLTCLRIPLCQSIKHDIYRMSRSTSTSAL